MAGIIVVFPKQEDSVSIKNLLIRNGYNVVASCTSGAQAINRADDVGEGIIISGYRLPDMLYKDIYHSVEGRFEMIVVASKSRVMEGDIPISTLTMPIKLSDLLNTVEMMQHNILVRRHKKNKKVIKRTEEEESILQHAKDVLMLKNHMSEAEAHRYLQKTSMNNGCSMVKTAQTILEIMYKD